MSSFRTALGQEFELERRLPRLGWKPRKRDAPDLFDVGMPDFGGDDVGILAVIGLLVVAVLAIVVLLPFLLLVAEVALVIALIIPITVVALTLGIKQHTVLLTRVADGRVVDQRQAHGVAGSLRAARALRSAANAGAYNG